MDFTPTYKKKRLTGVTETIYQRVVVKETSDEVELRGQTVEVLGMTTDGRILCVAGKVSAWLPEAAVDEVKK